VKVVYNNNSSNKQKENNVFPHQQTPHWDFTLIFSSCRQKFAQFVTRKIPVTSAEKSEGL
jgi:hypothetical protein